MIIEALCYCQEKEYKKSAKERKLGEKIFI